MDNELERALLELEERWGILPPSGSGDMPPSSRFAAVCLELAKRICPHRDSILSVIDHKHAETSSVVVDAFGSWITQTPFVYATITRKFAIVGIEKFCSNPIILVA